MNINIDKHSACGASVRVEIPAEKVVQERAAILKSFVRQARVPGFRPGKAPLAVIEQRFGEGIAEELSAKLHRQALDSLLQDHQDLKILNINAPRESKFSDDGAYSFETDLVLAPEFTLAAESYKGLEVEIPKAEINDELIDDQLAQLQARFADYEDVADRAIEKGDLAIIDYTSTVDGKPMHEVGGEQAKPLSENQGYWIRIEEEAFFPGFTEELIGLNVGEEKEIKVTLPTDFPIDVLREKEAVFHVKVGSLKKEVLPELNDEFAGKVVADKTLDDLKGLIREELQSQLDKRLNDVKVDRVVTKLQTLVDFELPEDFVKQETQGQANIIARQSAQQGATQQDLEARKDEILETAADRARQSVKVNFILHRIAEQEDIKANQNEVLQRITVLAKQAKTPLKKYIKELQKGGHITSIRENILIGKTIDFLVDNAKFNEVEATDDKQNDE